MGQTQIEKEIAAVTELWESCPLKRYQTRGNQFVSPEFYAGLRSLGWKPTPHAGFFKEVYLKRNLVVKFQACQTEYEYRIGGCDTEWRIWRRAKPWKRGYLARCYAYYKSVLLFQEKVPGLCWKTDECRKGRVVAEHLRIHDWTHNHGHKRNVRPIFFDYDSSGKRRPSCRKRKSVVR